MASFNERIINNYLRSKFINYYKINFFSFHRCVKINVNKDLIKEDINLWD